MPNEYSINLTWDNEASVWIATSDDVFGLILEDESIDVLMYRVRHAVPELLAFDSPVAEDISFDFIARRKERLAISG